MAHLIQKNHMQKITTLLMFNGKAEESMNFYTSIFVKSEILNIRRNENEEYKIRDCERPFGILHQ